jgi:hypothetical protein
MDRELLAGRSEAQSMMTNAIQVDARNDSLVLRSVRSQAAIVRALIDELGRIDELARLARRMEETASHLTANAHAEAAAPHEIGSRPCGT